MGWNERAAALTRSLGWVPGANRLIEPLRRRDAAHGPREADCVVDGTIRMRVDRGSYLGGSLYWYGCAARDQAALLRRTLTPGMVFVDAGANQGELTLIAAKRVPRGRVVAFEPVPANADRLRDNVARNGFANVTVVAAGLSRAAGRATFFGEGGDGARNEGATSLFPAAGRDRPAGQADLTTLDDAVRALGLTALDVLKIDVEGAELAVLEGARAALETFRPAILLESNRTMARAAGWEPEAAVALLKGLGYRGRVLGAFGRLRPVPPVLPPLLDLYFDRPG